MSHVIIIGGSYAGMAAALECRERMPEHEKITLVSAREDFIFFPSLIWVVQGEREIEDISFPVRPVLDEAGIEFVHGRLESIDPTSRTVTLSNGESLHYDKCLLATGAEWDWQAVPGLGPKPTGHSVSILSPQDALKAREDWQALLANPGPVVIGAAVNAGLYGAAYELALNLDTALRQANIRDQVSITFVTPEPYLGNLGHDGLGNSRAVIEKAFAHQDIYAITETQIERIEADSVVLGGNHPKLPSKFSMIVPPYKGIKPVRDVPGLGNNNGRIPVDDYYRSQKYPDIYAAGVAVQVEPLVKNLLPCDVLITGTVSARMGRIAGRNIAAELGYGKMVAHPVKDLKSFYVLDTGGHGLFMSLGAQSWLNVQLNVPGPWSHWAKGITEKYQMWQIQTGKN